MKNWKVTVNDIFTRKVFKHAKLIAGKEGGDREIKWTHILEMGDIESFINGGELILTTGSGIKFDSPEGIPYIEKLRKKNVAGICIELGTHIQSIHPEIIQYGNDHAFPLIIFQDIVKFVDITQDLHTLIINHHHQMLTQLNSFSKKVNELSLLPNGILKILKELYQHVHMPIFLLSEENQSHYYPPNMKDEIPIIQPLISKLDRHSRHEKYVNKRYCYTFFPIKGLGRTCGLLCLKDKPGMLGEFYFSLIDRAILAIAQIMLRNRTIEERKQNQEEELLRNLLQGKQCDLSDMQKFLPAPAKNLHYRLILVQSDTSDAYIKENEWEEIKLQQSILFRSLIRGNGCIPALSVNTNEIAIIAFFYKDADAKRDTERFMKIIHDIRTIQEKNVFLGAQCKLGVSDVKQGYSHLQTSYQEAKNVLLIRSCNILQTYFYEKIGVYRILLDMIQHDGLDAYIQEYLGPILEYDRKTKGNLLATLSTYLHCLGSKKETAEQLFIVRQTLYHRLDKIKELLGKDFMEPINRQAIELALAAYDLLRNTKQYDKITQSQFA